MNVNQSRMRPCTGCGACGAVCPRTAIVMKQDEYGFFAPNINDNLCVDCGLCTRVCYSHIDELNSSVQITSFYGWHTDERILKKSASGGITQALGVALMEQGFIVAGCKYDPVEKKAKHVLIHETGDLPQLSGSKYFQSDMTDFYSDLTKLDRDIKMVVFGTPCQILGIKKAMELLCFDMDQIILVELFCHGVLSPEVWRSYLRSRHRAEFIQDVRFRTKTYGWHYSSNEFVDSKGAVTATERLGDSFFRAFYSKKMFSKACYDCKARQNLGNADLRIGDFWGKRFLTNREGVSCILAFNEKGLSALDKCQKLFELHYADTKEILSGQSYNQVYDFNSEIWEKAYGTIKAHNNFKETIKVIRGNTPYFARVKEDIYVFLSNLKYNLFH